MSIIEAERITAKLVLAFAPEDGVVEAIGIAIFRDTELSPAEESAANQAFLDAEGDLSARRLLTKAR